MFPSWFVSGQSRSLDQAPERDAAHGIKPEGQSTPSCFPRPGAIAIPGTAGGQPVVTALGQLATDARFPPPDRAVVPSGSRWSEADGETGLPAVCCHSLVIPDPLPAPALAWRGGLRRPRLSLLVRKIAHSSRGYVAACQKDCSLVPEDTWLLVTKIAHSSVDTWLRCTRAVHDVRFLSLDPLMSVFCALDIPGGPARRGAVGQPPEWARERGAQARPMRRSHSRPRQ